MGDELIHNILENLISGTVGFPTPVNIPLKEIMLRENGMLPI
jgi:hypothetical protein